MACLATGKEHLYLFKALCSFFGGLKAPYEVQIIFYEAENNDDWGVNDTKGTKLNW